MITLEGQGPIRAGIAPEFGATLASLEWKQNGVWREMLYRAGLPPEKPGWNGQAQWLWPAVGRNFTEDQFLPGMEKPTQCQYLLDGTVYPIPIHGFAMNSAWEVEWTGPSRLVCLLRDTDVTRIFYPFAFETRVTFDLTDSGIRMLFHVIHLPGNSGAPMPFSVGNHISLLLPLADGTTAQEAQLQGQATLHAGVNARGFEEGGEEVDLSGGAPLLQMWWANAILAGFESSAAEMSVVGKESRIRITQRAVDMEKHGLTPADYRFVLYGSQESGYFCPEPWLGGPNSLNTRRGAVLLESGQEFRWEMEIQVS